MTIRMADLSEAVRARMPGAKWCNVVQPGASNSRRLGGRRAARAGASLEAEVLMAASRCREVVEIAELPKCGARFTGRGKAHPLPIPCDFMGCVVGPGRAIYFDAKHCGTGASFRCGDEKILKRHQAEFLAKMATAGAIAGLLVKCRTGYLWLDGRHLLSRETIRWDDARFRAVGETDTGIKFRMLVAKYQLVKP